MATRKKSGKKKPAAKKRVTIKKSKTVLVLRTCGPTGKSFNGFKWPLEVGATVECADWKPTKICGNGLHGLLNGEGDWGMLDWDVSAKVLILEVDAASVVDIGDKVKFPRAVVKQIGNLPDMLAYFVRERWTKDAGAIKASSGDSSRSASSGNSSRSASSGDWSRSASSGNWSRSASSGDSSSSASSGDLSRSASSGDSSSSASSGYSSSSASSGNWSSSASSGYSSSSASSGNSSSSASSGDLSRSASSGNSSSSASSGNSSSSASSGNSSRSASSGYSTISMVAGLNGRAKAGPNGCLSLCYNDGKRPRVVTGYVGEDGIEADTWYRVKNGKLVECEG
jgi:hypothetical protein